MFLTEKFLHGWALDCLVATEIEKLNYRNRLKDQSWPSAVNQLRSSGHGNRCSCLAGTELSWRLLSVADRRHAAQSLCCYPRQEYAAAHLTCNSISGTNDTRRPPAARPHHRSPQIRRAHCTIREPDRPELPVDCCPRPCLRSTGCRSAALLR